MQMQLSTYMSILTPRAWPYWTISLKLGKMLELISGVPSLAWKDLSRPAGAQPVPHACQPSSRPTRPYPSSSRLVGLPSTVRCFEVSASTIALT